MSVLGRSLAGLRGAGQRVGNVDLQPRWWRSPGRSEMLQWMECQERSGLFFLCCK